MRVAMATEGELLQLMGGGQFYRPNSKNIKPRNLRNELETVRIILHSE
jgi:hypothetical protein